MREEVRIVLVMNMRIGIVTCVCVCVVESDGRMAGRKKNKTKTIDMIRMLSS